MTLTNIAISRKCAEEHALELTELTWRLTDSEELRNLAAKRYSELMDEREAERPLELEVDFILDELEDEEATPDTQSNYIDSSRWFVADGIDICDILAVLSITIGIGWVIVLYCC